MLNKDEQELAAKNEYNFDHPDAFDFELLVNILRKLKKGKSIKVPVYDFTSHCRRKEWVRSEPGGLRQTRHNQGSALLVSFSAVHSFSWNKAGDEWSCREKSHFKHLLTE